MADRTCSVEGCARSEQLRRGMCNPHYRRWKASQPDHKPCKLDGCDDPSVSRGLCSLHYARLRRTGNHGEGSRRVRRYGEALEWLRNIPDTDECVEYPFSRLPYGYGVVRFEGRNRYAHHLTMLWAGMGEKPADLEACHSCDNSSCVNPKHLRWDTRQANIADRERARARNGRK